MTNTSEVKIPDEVREVGERVKLLNAELLPLLAKYKLGIGAVAFIMPDGRIGAQVKVFDDVKPENNDGSEKGDGLSKVE